MIETLARLKGHLDSLPDQQVGNASAISDVGEPYVELFEYAFARPDDVAIIERVVAQRMLLNLNHYLDGRNGRIYWRIPLEWDITPTKIVVKYDDDGPDIDFSTNQKCVKDGNWIKIAAYCRLYRASRAVIAA